MRELAKKQKQEEKKERREQAKLNPQPNENAVAETPVATSVDAAVTEG